MNTGRRSLRGYLIPGLLVASGVLAGCSATGTASEDMPQTLQVAISSEAPPELLMTDSLSPEQGCEGDGPNGVLGCVVEVPDPGQITELSVSGKAVLVVRGIGGRICSVFIEMAGGEMALSGTVLEEVDEGEIKVTNLLSIETIDSMRGSPVAEWPVWCDSSN